MTPKSHTAAPPSASWNPDADFYVGMFRCHSGLVKAVAKLLLFGALRDALQRGVANRPSAVAYRSYPGSLGRYEAAKAGFAEAGLLPSRYTAACRCAAKRARV